MGKYKDKHGYSRFSHWLGLNGRSVGDVISDSLGEYGIDFGESIRSLIAGWTGESMTGAGRESNEFAAEQAQMNRDFQQKMSSTAYQRQVTDMQNAGVNPALAFGSAAGGASTPSGAAASPIAPQPSMSMSDIMQIAMLPAQLKMMDAEVTGKQIQNEQEQINLDFLTKEKQTALALTESQILSVISSLENDKVQRALHRSGISLNEANAALSVQQAIATAIDNETRNALNESMLAYRAAETAYAEQKTEESRKNMEVLSAQVSELYSRAIMESANTGVLNQQAQNLLVEHGILEWNEKEHAFTVDHQKADRNWRIVNGVVDDVSKIAGAAGQFIGGFGILSKLGKGAPKSGSGLYVPNSMSAFGENYKYR